jgi:hypothetical protein
MRSKSQTNVDVLEQLQAFESTTYNQQPIYENTLKMKTLSLPSINHNASISSILPQNPETLKFPKPHKLL